MGFRIWAAAICAFLPLVLATSSAHALLGLVTGSVLIKQAGDQFNEAISNSQAAGIALIERGDQAAKERLDQINEILATTVARLVGQTEEKALNILKEATKAVTNIEDKLFRDLNQAIWNAECGGRRILVEDLQTTLGDVGKLIGTHQIEITPPIPGVRILPWYARECFACEDRPKFDVKVPFGNTFIDIRDYMESSIAQADEKTHSHAIVDTYAFLGALALKTSCFYPGSEERWSREYIQYQEKVKSWNNVVYVVIAR